MPLEVLRIRESFAWSSPPSKPNYARRKAGNRACWYDNGTAAPDCGSWHWIDVWGVRVCVVALFPCEDCPAVWADDF
ncbi:hypothetical protein MRX96_008413 [Rhipicephalus microplus]